MCNHIGNKINMVAIMLFHSYTNHGVECRQALSDLDRSFCLKECFCIALVPAVADLKACGSGYVWHS